MTTEPTPVEVPTADGPMPAHLWLPPGGEGPGLVVLQEIFGVSAYVRKRCADLADAGYVVLAPEVYWRLTDAEIDESGPDVVERAMSVVGRVDWDAAVADGVAALTALRGRREVIEGVGVVGFCFGGGLAFAVAAADDPDLLVAYYGSALPALTDLAPKVTAPSLHHFGTADSYLPMPEVERIRAALDRPDVRVELHEGAGHAFDNPMPAFHHAEASACAWEQTLDFLERHLPVAD